MSKGLKELKRLPKAIKDTFKDSFDIIEKELKALEVYKKKILNSEPGLSDSDFRELHIVNGNKPSEDSYWVLGVEVSQEDYRLLKEVFYDK